MLEERPASCRGALLLPAPKSFWYSLFMDFQELWIPWAVWQQVDTPSTYIQRTDPEEFRNTTEDDIWIDRVIIDSNDVTSASVKMGKHGQIEHNDVYVSTLAFQNTLIMNNTSDCNRPLWRFRKPCVVMPKEVIYVELRDASGGDRVANITFYGYRKDSHEPYYLTERVTVPASGVVAASLLLDIEEPFVLTDFGLYMEENGTAALMRQLSWRVRSPSLGTFPNIAGLASVLSPERNGAAEVWAPPGPLILHPGEAFSMEFLDTTGDQTLYVGVLGFQRDRRTR